MKKLLAIACVALLGANVAFGQAKAAAAPPPPKKVLTQAFIDKLVAELPAITKELEAVSDDFEEQFGGGADDSGGFSPAAMQQVLGALKADARVKAVLAKHGMNESFWEGYVAVLMGYSAVALEEAAAEAEKSQPGSSAMFKEMLAQSKAWAHADDMALVRKNRPRLEKLFEELDD